MSHAIELYAMLTLYFSGNKARVVCMTNILMGLLKSASTNLFKVASNMPGETKLMSKYRRIQRFFAEVELNFDQLAEFIVKQIAPQGKHILILDRTNWKFGAIDINFLVLSIAWCGISIPIYWINLARAGNSDTKERMQIISKFVMLLGIDKIEAILADREFIGEDWLHWLDHYGIKFVIRIKDNSQLYFNKKYRRAIKSFRTLTREHTRYISCTLWGLGLTIVGYKDASGIVYILATNDNADKALGLYAVRWQIECMFLCLKSNGFDLEQTHMTDASKLDLLFGLLAILTCWNCKIGCWGHALKPIKIKKHDRPAHGLFGYGMKIMSTVFNNIVDYVNDFRIIIKILRHRKLPNCIQPNMVLQCL